MLNLVNTLQSQVQTKQATANNNDNSRPNESKREQFDKILAREVTEKKNTPTAEHTAHTTSNTASETTEDAQKQTDNANVADIASTNNTATPTNENTDAIPNGKVSETTEATQKPIKAISVNDTYHGIGPINNISQTYSLETKQYSVDQTAQTAFAENNFGIEIMPPLQPATISMLPQNQLNINVKNPALGLGQSQNSAASLLSSQPGSQQGLMQDFLDDNRSWQSLQTANPAGDGKILSFSTLTHKEILSRLSEPSVLTHIDSDATQQSGLNNLAQIFSPSSPQAAAPHNLSLDTQIGQPKWNGDFAQKVVWLVNQQNQVAELRLNPAHLGPVEIMLSLTSENGTQATAQFVSPHLAVREAIEAALPKLRELMAENGIQLGDVMVGAESFQRQKQGEQRPSYSAGNAHVFGANNESDAHLEKSIVPNRHIGMVNTFA
ncbi:MAG TPA: flagellar hook-length control protein FliK [Nitrosomonas sp.]|nr:flagellar hook-length control protein FliK [Nitrosomonas sp.]